MLGRARTCHSSLILAKHVVKRCPCPGACRCCRNPDLSAPQVTADGIAFARGPWRESGLCGRSCRCPEGVSYHRSAVIWIPSPCETIFHGPRS